MALEIYAEKNSSDIYDDFSLMSDDEYPEENEERSSDRMEDMISKYGRY